MTTYLDVRAVRIQSYLARWPSLRGRRGASALLSQATRAEAVAAAVPGTRPNEEGAPVNGVVKLVVEPGTDPEAAAVQAIDHLTALLPAVELSATWGDGASYAEAHHRAIGPRAARNDAVLSIPPVADFPVVRLCDLCATFPAVTEVRVRDGQQRACADCAARHECADRSAGPEAELAARFGGLRLTDDFGDLAGLGPGPGDNHLATVYVDGNGIGQVFSAIVSAHGDAAAASVALAEATRDALERATAAVLRPDDPSLSVVPHVVGGDDVLVSLPARRAWPFTVTLLSTLGELCSERLGPLLPPATPPVTASAGVLFAHRSHPFSSCVELADTLLDAAKRHGGGSASTILWADVTQESGVAPPRRRAWTADALAERHDLLGELAATPRSMRSTLRRATAHPDDEVALAQARGLAVRLGQGAPMELLRGRDVQLLRDALDLTRWWPVEPEEVR